MTRTTLARPARRGKRVRASLAGTAALTMVLSACAGDDAGGDGGDGGNGEGGDIIVGTTDEVRTLDPARCYDYYCSNILDNVGSTLVTYAPGESDTSPDVAAEEPEISADGLTYTFTLRDDITFHDGSELTSEDVKFSLERSRDINHPEGAGYLLASIDSIDTPDPTTVEITLEEADATFASKLAYNVATILPSDGDYQAPDEPLGEDASAEDYDQYVNEELVASGPYTLEGYQQGESVNLQAFEDYFGEAPSNDRVLVSFFDESAQMGTALQSGEIDVAFRELTPEQRTSLEDSEEIDTIEGEGASIRYLVLNPNLEPFDDPDVGRAIAAAVDRERLVDEVLNGAGEPLYSMVPPFFEDANIPAFQDEYADAEPSDFVDGEVDIDLWYTTDHYGPTEPALAETVARMLEESGSFNVNQESAPWAEFSENNAPGSTGQYPAHLLGWYPDYLDPDNYIQPFYDSGGYLQMYENAEMDELIRTEQTAEDADSAERTETFAEIQQLAAEDAPVIPLYVETPLAFARSDVDGVAETMDASQIFRYSVISK